MSNFWKYCRGVLFAALFFGAFVGLSVFVFVNSLKDVINPESSVIVFDPFSALVMGVLFVVFVVIFRKENISHRDADIVSLDDFMREEV